MTHDERGLAQVCLHYLLSARAVDRDAWLHVGMALHSVSGDLLDDWIEFSRHSDKFKEGECERQWKGFKRRGGLGMGSLVKWAQVDGGQRFDQAHAQWKAEHRSDLFITKQGLNLTAVERELTVSEDETRGSALVRGDSHASVHKAIVSLGLGKPSVMYNYHDAQQQLIMVVARFERPGGKTFRPFCLSENSWRVGDPPGLLPLYRLPALLDATHVYVYVCEGEKAADAACSLGLTATCSAHGAASAAKTDWSPLAGKDVVILPDHDDAGERYAEAVIDQLLALDPSPTIRVVDLVGLADGQDIVEYVAAQSDQQPQEIAAAIARQAANSPLRTRSRDLAGERPVLIRLDSVHSQPVDWLWENFIPRGKITAIAGDPATGKSLITNDLAARVTTGVGFPDGSVAILGPSNVLFLSAEDGVADTIKPRLEAAGADVSRVTVLDGVSGGGQPHDASFMLSEHMERLCDAIEVTGAKLVIIDPLNAHLGGVDAHRDADIRGVLKPLAALAERLGVAIVLVAHLNKSNGTKAMYRVMGSLGVVAAARLAFLVIRDPQDPKRRLMCMVKCNIAAEPPTLAYTITGVAVGAIESVAKLLWERDPIDLTADQLLSLEVDGPSEQEEERQDCAAWLGQLLHRWGALPVKLIQHEASELWSHSQLQRAMRRIKAKHQRVGFGEGSMVYWCHPGQSPPRAIPKHHSDLQLAASADVASEPIDDIGELPL